MTRLLALAALCALAACSDPAVAPAADEPPALETAIATDMATVDTPESNARVTSPLHVTGTAPANWYFENQFPVRLVGADGHDIAQAAAIPRVNWTENAEPKQFDATLTFNVSAETEAMLVLQEDMPGENAAPREVRIPVVLAP